jgi:hypothetical protein
MATLTTSWHTPRCSAQSSSKVHEHPRVYWTRCYLTPVWVLTRAQILIRRPLISAVASAVAQPHRRFQLTGAPVPSSARTLSADGGHRNAEFGTPRLTADS